MSVFYNVAHDGLLIKAFAHRYKYHLNDSAVFLVNKKFYGKTDRKVFDNTRFIYLDMHKFSTDEGKDLEDNIVNYVELSLVKQRVVIKKYKKIYSLVDEVDLFGIFCENKQIYYCQIEIGANIFQRFEKFKSRGLEQIRASIVLPYTTEYGNIMRKHRLRFAGGRMCENRIFASTTYQFPKYISDISTIARWDYKGILGEMSLIYLKQIAIFYKFPDIANGNGDISLLIFASRLVFSLTPAIRACSFSDTQSLDREFILAYQFVADFFTAKQATVYFKPHPRESEFNFSPHIDEKALIPSLFPTEIIQFFNNFKVSEFVSTTSSSGDYFTEKQRPSSVMLGSSYFGFYPYLIKFLVITELLNYCSSQFQNIYISGTLQVISDEFLRKNCDYSEFNLISLFGYIPPPYNVLIIANLMEDKDKKRLKVMMTESNAKFAIIFFNTEEFNGIFNSSFPTDLKAISIKKNPLVHHTLVDLNDEYIYIFEKGTNYFDGIKDFNINSKLIYSGVEVCAKYSELTNIEQRLEQTAINVSTEIIEIENKGDSVEMIDQKFSKYRERGIAFSTSVNYVAKIENGILHVQLTELPLGICVGYELLRNMKVIDSLSTSYVTKASFELKHFGDYSVRIRFYKSKNLNATIYLYDTIHFVYTLSSVVGTLNPNGYDFENARDRLERLLFDESHHKEQMGELLSALSHQTSLGYSFIDYLLSMNITSLYFYCEERDWELGRALFSLLYNDARITIKECISEIPFKGESIDKLYRPVKFNHKDANYYEEEENVLIASVFPQPNLEYEFKKLGLNVYKIDEITTAVLNKGLFVSPYNEIKQCNPNVDIVFVKKPSSLRRVKKDARTDNENDIVAKKVNIAVMRTGLRQSPPKMPLALTDCGVMQEDAEEFVAYTGDMTSDIDGYARCVDRQGRLVNVTDGYRMTTDQPEQFDNTIYFYGNNMVYSPFTSDDKTAASCLQRLLNTNCKNRYKVINCGGWSRLTLTNMINNMLKAHKYKDGDKIVIMLDSIPDPNEVDYTLIDLGELYARPHEYGEIWIDARNNVNQVGQKLLAEGLFDGLVEKGLIRLFKS
ncbi:MAG: hypothetical protein FWG67_03020 [Defluviitaleaceae bacterium]|nr:hypothetical protein [Defluviitaleaceae bacterium]